MIILVAGSHGMIGSAVTHHWIECGHEVVHLVRITPGRGDVWWDPDAVNLATMRWAMCCLREAKKILRANRVAQFLAAFAEHDFLSYPAFFRRQSSTVTSVG